MPYIHDLSYTDLEISIREVPSQRLGDDSARKRGMTDIGKGEQEARSSRVPQRLSIRSYDDR